MNCYDSRKRFNLLQVHSFLPLHDIDNNDRHITLYNEFSTEEERNQYIRNEYSKYQYAEYSNFPLVLEH